MISTTEISHIHIHTDKQCTRYTIVLQAYPTRRLSAVEFRRDETEGKYWYPISAAETLHYHSILLRYRIVVLTTECPDRLYRMFDIMRKDCERLVKTLRQTTGNNYWADALVMCTDKGTVLPVGADGLSAP